MNKREFYRMMRMGVDGITKMIGMYDFGKAEQRKAFQKFIISCFFVLSTCN